MSRGFSWISALLLARGCTVAELLADVHSLEQKEIVSSVSWSLVLFFPSSLFSSFPGIVEAGILSTHPLTDRAINGRLPLARLWQATVWRSGAWGKE